MLDSHKLSNLFFSTGGPETEHNILDVGSSVLRGGGNHFP